MLHQRPLDVELGACRVVSVGIFTVKCETCGGGQLQANLGVEPCHCAGGVERPTVNRDVGNAAVAPRTDRNVQKSIEVPMPVPLMPADERIERRIAKVGRALIEIEMPVCLYSPVQQRQGQGGKGINVDIYGLATIRNDDAQANISAKHLFRRYP